MAMKQHANLTQEMIQESFVDENGQDNGVSARITDEIGTCTTVMRSGKKVPRAPPTTNHPFALVRERRTD